MHFTELFIRRPVMTTLVMMAIVVAGVLGYVAGMLVSYGVAPLLSAGGALTSGSGSPFSPGVQVAQATSASRSPASRT